ncbi:hypothetical protein TWF694_004274 [Orbilia ellipsospora]|uniref:Uncharacterized protein n=1 Tax=Orbilia ellipsospora TaxID=2528407 RepID=A0AAV9X025_9PEZI
MPKSTSNSSSSQSGDDTLSHATSQLHIRSPDPFQPLPTDSGLQFQTKHIANGVRYSPSPFFASLEPPPVLHPSEAAYPSYEGYEYATQTSGLEPSLYEEFLQGYTTPTDNQDPPRRSFGGTNTQGSVTYPMFSPEGPLHTFPQSFQQQLPQHYQHMSYMANQRLDANSVRRERWIEQQQQLLPEKFSYGSQHSTASGWETSSDFDDRSSMRGTQSDVYVFPSEPENPFLSNRGKARFDNEGGIRHLYRPINNLSTFNKKLHAEAVTFQFPVRNRLEEDTRFKPSLLQKRTEIENLPGMYRPRSHGETQKTPTKSLVSGDRATFWEFEHHPSLEHSPIVDQSEKVKSEKTQDSEQLETKSITESELAEKHSIFQNPAAVEALRAEARKRIQDQFKAQVAKKFEESQKVIEPVSIMNDAYLRMNKLGLLAHPALKLGLIHGKADTRNVHEKFGELINSIRMEETYQMDQHVELSESLLIDLNLTYWNLIISEDKELKPIRTPFDIMGVPMPEPYGDFTNKYGISQRCIAKHFPQRVFVKETGPLSNDPMTREIQLRKGAWSTMGRYRQYVNHPLYGNLDSATSKTEAFDFQFRVKPAHWTPPKGYERNFPSAERWEEISIIKTFHQALTVQQHLYLSFLNLGPTFSIYWFFFTMAKEREAMIVRAFNYTMNMSSDDGHEWVDSDWAELTNEEKRGRESNLPRDQLKFNLSDYRNEDETGFPVQFGRDMYKGITIKINDNPPLPRNPPEKNMASYSLFCHELHPYYLARDPACLYKLINTCLINPDLENFPAEPEALGENYFWKPAISVKDPNKVDLGPQLDRSLPYLPGIPLGANIKHRVQADRTFFYSAFFYNLLTVFRDHRDEKVWFYGNGVPDRYDPNDPPPMLGQRRNKYPRREKWIEGSEIEKHVIQLQHLADILNMGICIDKWIPEDDVEEEERPEKPELETWFGAKRANVNQRAASPLLK